MRVFYTLFLDKITGAAQIIIRLLCDVSCLPGEGIELDRKCESQDTQLCLSSSVFPVVKYNMVGRTYFSDEYYIN